MLRERGVEFTYREYTAQPLSRVEIVRVLALLGASPRDVLRARDAKKEGLTGEESDEVLLDRMSEVPGLLQRPILLGEGRGVIGRPVDRLEAFLDS